MKSAFKHSFLYRKELCQITYFIEHIEEIAKPHLVKYGFYDLNVTFKVLDSSLTFDELKQRAFELGIIKDEPKWNLKKKA